MKRRYISALVGIGTAAMLAVPGVASASTVGHQTKSVSSHQRSENWGGHCWGNQGWGNGWGNDGWGNQGWGNQGWGWHRHCRWHGGWGQGW
jgi:hypothetical protein